MRLFLSIASVTVLLVSRSSAQTTIHSTFGPGDSYSVAGGPTINEIYRVAAGFLYAGPSGDLLSAIRFAAFRLPAFGSGPLAISFLSGPTIGGASGLESWSVPNNDGTPEIFSLASLNQPTLTTGQTYWVMLALESDVSNWGWNYNDQGFMAGIDGLLFTSGDNGATWQDCIQCPMTAFDVTSIPGSAIEGSVAPEPATLTLLATGLVGLGIMQRRRRRV